MVILCQIPRNSRKVSWCQSKAHILSYWPLILTLDVSLTVYVILTHSARKIALFSPLRTCLPPHSGWTLCDINVTYTSLNSALISSPYLLPFSRYSSLKIENCWFYPLSLVLRSRSWWLWPLSNFVMKFGRQTDGHVALTKTLASISSRG